MGFEPQDAVRHDPEDDMTAQPAEAVSNKPSKITDEYWVRTKAPVEVLRARVPHPDRTGKWMIFQRPEAHDALWEQVKVETEAGRLGIGSKAATRKSNPLSLGKKLPIMVYTYDYIDQEDVMRVRDALRELGVTWPISYKPDKATRAGQYSTRGDRVSMYRV